MKIFKLFLVIIISLVFSNQVFSEDKILESLEEGGKIIFIRHAYAPGGGDPENFNINDCSTQRNLNDEMRALLNQDLLENFLKQKKLKLIKFYQASGAGVKTLQNLPLIILKHLMH